MVIVKVGSKPGRPRWGYALGEKNSGARGGEDIIQPAARFLSEAQPVIRLAVSVRSSRCIEQNE